MISIGEIIYRINEHPMLRSVRKSDIVTHIKTVIELVGVPALKEEKMVKLELIDYRVKLPEDFSARVTVRAVIDGRRIVMQHSTDQFAKFNDKLYNDTTQELSDVLFTHYIVDGYLYSDLKDGDIELVYLAYSLDENGWPKIPKNESLILAIENYIKARHFGIRADMNPQRYEKAYQRAEQQYTWYVAQATSSMLSLDPVEAEALGNRIIRMIPLKDEFFTNNKYSGQPERLRRDIW